MVLVFTGGEHPSIPNTKQFIHTIKNSISTSLIKNNKQCKPHIIVADSGLSFCEKCGFVPDIICGDFDSLEEKYKQPKEEITFFLQEKYPTSTIQLWPKDKEYTDTEIALQEAIKKRSPTKTSNDIILIGGDGGRSDHFFANIKLFEKSIAPDYWLCKKQYIQVLKEGHTYNIQQQSEFSIFPIYTGKKNNHHIQSKNLMWNLDKLRWDRGIYSLGNRCLDTSKKANVIVHTGRFLFFAPYY
ncbi:MAG TPA: thiamine diphosphokinase [Treponemataceae bacterium]|nr:thiamine diphosphokinase [Treponemataceae bacterium]